MWRVRSVAETPRTRRQGMMLTPKRRLGTTTSPRSSTNKSTSRVSTTNCPMRVPPTIPMSSGIPTESPARIRTLPAPASAEVDERMNSRRDDSDISTRKCTVSRVLRYRARRPRPASMRTTPRIPKPMAGSVADSGTNDVRSASSTKSPSRGRSDTPPSGRYSRRFAAWSIRSGVCSRMVQVIPVASIASPTPFGAKPHRRENHIHA